jgi:PAS domain S-box-containing protein
MKSDLQGVFVTTTDGPVSEANDAFLKIIGYTRDDLEAGRISWKTMTPPEWAHLDVHAVQELAAHGHCAAWEKEYIRKDGSRVPVLVGAALLEGSRNEGIAFAVDITERKRAEAALRESDRRLATLISNLPGYVYRVANNPDFTAEYLSGGVEALTGWQSHDYVVARAIHRGAEVHPEDRDAVWQRVQAAVAARVPYECEYRVSTRSGDLKWVWDRGRGDFSPTGDLMALEGVVTDITARKQLEEQLRQVQKLEAVGQLAGGVAHDFNNILTIIQGHLAMLGMHEALPEEVRDSLADMRTAADRAASLTRQLLTFSRRQAMRQGLVDLNSVVANMARMFERILGEDIRLDLELDPREAVVSGDTGMLEQVLLNLAVNSRDAMPRGGRLLIRTALVEFDAAITARVPAARAGTFVCLSTTDTGTGIPAHVLPRIFEPFFTTKETGKGSGLGLATVYGIVQQHEGWITVESEPGRGTTFQVYLPQRAGPVSAPEARVETRARGGDEAILLVEDEAALRNLVSNVLGRMGYRVFTAATGPQALELWRAHETAIQLLVTDLVMPDGLSGFDLSSRLTREAAHLRVIYTSGYSPQLVGRGEELITGVNFLPKPFEMDQLLQAIRNALDRQSSMAS